MSPLFMIVILIIGVIAGSVLGKTNTLEGFHTNDSCNLCGKPPPCSCSEVAHTSRPVCKKHDMSKYVLKSAIPSCSACPDMTNYILKSEVPPSPDMSKYVLKSSIPRQQPVILDCTKCSKGGECPPCPRARCPEVRCPEPTKCPGCAPCPRAECPPAVIKCKAEERLKDPVRPFLAPLDFHTFGNY